ncbi:MAG: hypothetical protein L3J04_00360 [Robiginitomaculum sp.]|nr:hypothetical protein [Robiginitomaculum sp.]
MRLAEPLFLSTGNVIIDTPYPYMNLDLSKQKLKNAGSEREVPIHPDLIEFGFIDFVKVRQKAGLSGRLFHRITSKGDVSNYYSKYLGRYIDRIGLTDPRLVAHSFRHGFKDALRNANIPEGEQYRIMGQSPKDVGQTYGVGSDINVLWEHAAKTDLLLTDEVKELLKGKK